MRATTILATAVVAEAAYGKSRAFLASDLQPEVVAHTLLKVEEEWRAQATSFTDCNATEAADCSSAVNAFQKSCSTVVDAVVKASEGDRSRVSEYMGIVCGQNELGGWHQSRCSELASAVFGSMSDDNYENRENLNTAKTCTGFWSKFTVEEKARLDEERAERAAAEKKAEEERAAAEKKAEEERVEAEKQAAAAAAEEAKRREKEEAEQKAEAAKKQAEEAAAALKAKREEAERQAEEAKHQAEEAKKKMEEAQAAAEEAAMKHREMVAKANATNGTNVTVTNATKVSQVIQNASVPVSNVNASNTTAVNASK